MATTRFKPFHFKFKPFEPDLIPIFPMEVSFNISHWQNPRNKIHRQQYPICTGYVFTDHKAQRQTLKNIMVDIGTTKKFPVTLFPVMKQRAGQHRTVEEF
jgi:hypothetical protein